MKVSEKVTRSTLTPKENTYERKILMKGTLRFAKRGGGREVVKGTFHFRDGKLTFNNVLKDGPRILESASIINIGSFPPTHDILEFEGQSEGWSTKWFIQI